MAKQTLPNVSQHSAPAESVASGLAFNAEQKDSVALQAASMMFNEIASLAADADAECYEAHGDLCAGAELDADAVSRELGKLRDIICRLGWMADHASSQIASSSVVRGDASEWLLAPLTKQALRACRDKP